MAGKSKEKKTVVSKKTTRKVEKKDIKIEETKSSQKYLQCPFCFEKHYERLGRDEGSSWCSSCGKCFSVEWKE